jgi:hypothetical protein
MRPIRQVSEVEIGAITVFTIEELYIFVNIFKKHGLIKVIEQTTRVVPSR